ncbi:MAG: Gldg family protein [Planctomycetes bacterium]|nr:Gldg family protein [Planctomycetota bacterium]
MRNALVVARRELSQLFHSPLAYVFLILFVVLVQLFQVLALFAQGTADLRMFFDTLPWGVALFAAFVTMRSWAEERQENTYEMLLTFPMRDGELVLGKFIASFSFLLLGLACTLTLPLAVVVLGDPDVGTIVSGYLGNTLIAAMWCAGGIFFSGLTRSQLLAVIATAAIAIVSLILGTEIVGTLLGARFGWVGGLIESMVGGWSHYAAFAKGVVELADACYFAAWTLAFLWLNTLYVGVRRSPGRGAVLAVGTPLALGCAMLVGRITAGESWARADLTEDHLYTLSGGTVRILERAKVPIRVTYFVSPRDEMPKEYDALERQVMDRLHELEIASRGRIVARVSHQSAKNAVVEDETNIDDENPEKALEKAAADPEKSKERRAAAKGVRPFPVSSFGATEQSTKLIYSTIAIRYREKDEELLQPIVPERLSDLEYLTANTVARLVRARPPKIALYLGPEPMDPQLKQMYQQMKRELPDPFAGIEQMLQREKFDVQRIGLTAHEPMPDDYDALVMIGPADLDERQQWEVNRALREGKPTLIAAQRYTWDYRQVERRITANRTTTDPGLDAILDAQGLGVSRDISMSGERRSRSTHRASRRTRSPRSPCSRRVRGRGPSAPTTRSSRSRSRPAASRSDRSRCWRGASSRTRSPGRRGRPGRSRWKT